MVAKNDEITNEIRGDLITIAQLMQQKAIIPKAIAEEIEENTGAPRRTKAAMLLNHLLDKVQVNTAHFEEFCEILVKQNDVSLATKLRQHCKETPPGP